MNGKKYIILLFFTLISFGVAQVPSTNDQESFLNFLFKGGYVFSEDEIFGVISDEGWTPEQKAILKVQMLASSEKEERTRTAIAEASDYIGNGSVQWAVDFLRMQRGFLRGLITENAAGTDDLEKVVSSEFLGGIDYVKDPLLDAIRNRNGSLSVYLNDAMYQNLGYFYMDYAEGGIQPAKAFERFNHITSEPLREKCIQQLKYRLGDEADNFLESIKSDVEEKEKINGAGQSSSRPVAGGSNSAVRQSKTSNEDSFKEGKKPSDRNYFIELFLLFGLLLAVIIFVGLGFKRRSSPLP